MSIYTEVKVVADAIKEMFAKGEIEAAINALIATGHGYHVTVGAFSTGIAGGGAGTILDLDQPEAVLSIGSGLAMIPVRLHIQGETPLLAADDDEVEILIAVDRANGWAGDGTFTAETVFNMRTDLGGAPNGVIAAASAFSADMTAVGGADPVLDMELARSIKVGDVQGTAANALWDGVELLYEPRRPPIIVAGTTGAAIYVYWGGTVAVNGYAQLEVVAFPSGWVKSLS